MLYAWYQFLQIYCVNSEASEIETTWVRSRKMSEEGPKLYADRPKKGQIKQFQEHHPTVKEVSTSAGPSSMASQSSSPPTQPPKESFARRYKFLWPMLLTVNLAVGAYLYMRTETKDSETEIEPAAADLASSTAAIVAEEPKQVSAPAIVEAVRVAEPIPEDRQRELFKWMLEEKRKIKTKDPEEKKQIDEEKAILKQFIRMKWIPNI